MLQAPSLCAGCGPCAELVKLTKAAAAYGRTATRGFDINAAFNTLSKLAAQPAGYLLTGTQPPVGELQVLEAEHR
jgi:hypothetical protein